MFVYLHVVERPFARAVGTYAYAELFRVHARGEVDSIFFPAAVRAFDRFQPLHAAADFGVAVRLHYARFK